jgi:hypothetical protein
MSVGYEIAYLESPRKGDNRAEGVYCCGADFRRERGVCERPGRDWYWDDARYRSHHDVYRSC